MLAVLIRRSILFLCIFGSFSIFPQESLHIWIKTHRWDLINDRFKSKSPSKESEVYSLIEYNAKAPDANPEKRFILLISQVKGSFVSNYNRADIDSILSINLPHQSIVFRLSYWKLYQELVARKILTTQEQIIYLKKASWDTDPVSKKVFDELIQIYQNNELNQEIVNQVNALYKEERRYYLNKETWLRYAKALAKIGELKKAKDEYILLAMDSDTPDYLKTAIYQDLKKFYTEDAFQNLKITEVYSFLNQMKGEEAFEFYKKNKIEFRSRIPHSISFYQAARYLSLKNEPDTLISLLLSNRVHLKREDDILGKLGEIFYSQNNCENAIRLLERFPEYHDPGKYKILHLCYEKLGQNELAIDYLIRYLAQYPFNLFYQDKLIDFLITKNEKSISYAPEIYWKKSIEEMPDLPVKGRLVYWYLRYLKESQKNDELNKELRTYYKKIAGSYYTRVIREEFSENLSHIPEPKNPTSNRESLFEYLSLTGGDPKLSGKIVKKNLGFAYMDRSFDLGIRLSNSYSKVKGERLLSLASDYLRLGEESLGMSLFQFYAKEKNISILEKEELLVGMGEASQNTYYMAFYTRSLLKRLFIADDPILLPTSVSARIYPRPHRELVLNYSRESGISEDVVYAIMRQESFYKENAVSRTNAQGLMQIMPATGRELAQNLGVAEYSLFNPVTSIRFGSKFLGYLMRENQNDMRWASIAYNGGPGNLRKWKRNHYNGDFNHFLEDVPYKESRDYCRITVSNFYAYEIMRAFHGL
jgi:hypothetical protein